MRVNFFGPANNFGTGVHCVNLAKAWEDLGGGREVCLVPPFGGVSIRDPRVDAWIERRARFSENNPSVMIFDTSFLTQFCGTPRIGFAVFETDRLSPVQEAAVRSCDHVFVPSQWARGVLKGQHMIDARVVQEGFDPEAFPVNLEPSRNKVVTFLHVGKFEERKGTLQTLRCFFKALENRDARLVMHCENKFVYGDGWIEMDRELMRLGFHLDNGGADNPAPGNWSRAGLHVELSSARSSISELYRSADCGVFPSKGEGWGLPILECIASGTPAIVGNWTGQSEFLGDNYPRALTLKMGRKEVANDGQWFHGDRGSWIVPDDQDLCDRIQYAYENILDFRTGAFWDMTVKRIREFTWEAAAVRFDMEISECVQHAE